MPDYSQAKIYKITNTDGSKVYYGSTLMRLSQRLSQHRSQYKNYLENKHNYITSFEVIKEPIYFIVLVEMVNCTSREELFKRERFFIESNLCVNKVIPLRTPQEYYVNHHARINDKSKQYYKDNIVRLQTDAKIKTKCECGGDYTNSNKGTHCKTSKHKKYLCEKANKDNSDDSTDSETDDSEIEI